MKRSILIQLGPTIRQMDYKHYIQTARAITTPPLDHILYFVTRKEIITQLPDISLFILTKNGNLQTRQMDLKHCI